MFDLEKAIAEWRRQMIAAGIRRADHLDELEGHLRDEIAQELRSGKLAKEAFEAAVQRFGAADTISMEFEKITRQHHRLRYGVKGLLALVLSTIVLVTGTYALVNLPVTLDARWDLVAVALVLAAVVVRRVFRRDRGNLEIPDRSAFSVSAAEALNIAEGQAPRFHHDYVGTEHLLLGLLQTGPSGAVPKLLHNLGLEPQTVRNELEKFIIAGRDTRLKQQLRYTPRAKRALALAVKEARHLHHQSVDGEHILLGLLLEGDGMAALALKNLGLDGNRVREQIVAAG